MTYTEEGGTRPALLILTDLAAIARHLTLIEDAERRGLVPLLVFGPETPAGQLERLRAAGHPAAGARHTALAGDYGLDAALGALLPWRAGHRPRAVLACGESWVETAGVLAETLGLDGPGTHAARVCRDKTLQRLAAPSLAPRWTALRADTPVDTLRWDHYPAVLKPTGRMCSSGVREITGADDLRARLPDYPRAEPLLLEERVLGPEYSVESLVHRGEVVWAGITAKRTNEDTTRYFTETAHTSPAAGLPPEAERRLLDANAALLAAVRMRSGITHAEFRLDGGRAVLMEVAARLPGDAVSRLWHLALGRPLEPAVLDVALGTRPELPAPRRRARQHYLDHDHGVLEGVEAGSAPVTWTGAAARWPVTRPLDAAAPARAHAVVVGREPGDLLGTAADSTGRSVSVILDAPLADDIDGHAERLAESVAVRTRPADAAPPTAPLTAVPTAVPSTGLCLEEAP